MLYFVIRYDEMAERRVENGLASECAKIVAIKRSPEDLKFYLHKNLDKLGDSEKFVIVESEGILMNLADRGFLNELAPA